jgi:hypothetical protein
MFTSSFVSRLAAPLAIGLIAGSASADFLGWTANVRSATTGGYLVNVFAVTSLASDRLFNVYGSNPSSPNAGYIRTTSTGGFLQGTGTQSIFAAEEFQNWNSSDSFLTISSILNGGDWLADSATIGDASWNVTYTTLANTPKTVNSFSVRSGSFTNANFINPNTNSVPDTAGFYLAGSSAQAVSLESLTNRVASSTPDAAAGTLGIMVAQLHMSELNLDWKMGATIGRGNGTADQKTFSLQIVPAPGAIALLGISGLLSGAHRRRSVC